MSIFNFKKSKPKFSITNADSNWVEENFEWFIEAGGYPDLATIQLQFTSDFFPN